MGKPRPYDDYPPILDTEQTAELLGMNVRSVRRAVREGRLPAYRLPGGQRNRFFRDELIAWLRSHRHDLHPGGSGDDLACGFHVR